MKYGFKILGFNFLALLLFLTDRKLKSIFVELDRFYTNQNIAFGIKIDLDILYALIGVILFLLIIWLSYSYYKKTVLEIFALSLMLVGSVSNLIDRLKLGYVIDYINFPHFSIFNLADVMIVVGGILLVYKILKK